ncbi:MAG: propionyl-CoA carboxylase [Chloroflexi bacterium]|nr:propionyl-CoA carboxylase [Chloroflexota bacterium]MDA1001756.1 propionyl-CoA carboxylase [Chloroflexota bacterium]
MTWQPEVEEIERRRRLAEQMGGPAAVERQHARGLLTIRERIDELVDVGSFQEIGRLTASAERDDDGNLVSLTPSNAVIGTARIDGQDVVIGGEDATIRGGASDGGGSAKGYYMEHLARRMRLPLVRLHEGAGGSVRTNRSRHSGNAISGQPVSPHADLLGTVPVATAAMGACAGIVAARVAQSHFSVMARNTAFLFAGGPPVVERALGWSVSKEDLGGWQVHTRSGIVDNLAEDEADCLRQVKTFLSYMPSNAWMLPQRRDCADPADRRDEDLLSLMPRDRRRPFNPRKLIACVLDQDSYFELAPYFGRSLMTGLARLDGYPVGVTCNNPNFEGGAMTADSSEKLTRFIDLCDSFHLPVLSFEDEPGFMVGVEAETAGTLRQGVRAQSAVSQATVPWMKFIVRRAYGVAAGLHHNGNGPVYAWPSGEWGSIPIEGGVWAAYRREIEAAPDPDARRQELEDLHSRDRSPFFRAESFGLYDLIDPRESRPLAVQFIRHAQIQLATRELGPRMRTMRP